MAKYERTFQGNFDDLLNILNSGILNGSASASFEDGSDYSYNDIRCAVRVYERYSMIGGNRVSLNITSGGSQAVFFKMNTMGEESFLDCVEEIVENYLH